MHQKLFYLSMLSIVFSFSLVIQSAEHLVSGEEEFKKNKQWESVLCAINQGNLEKFEKYATTEIVLQDGLPASKHGALIAAAAATKHSNIPAIIGKLIELGIQPNAETMWTKISHQYIQWSCPTLSYESVSTHHSLPKSEARSPLDIALLCGNVAAAKALLEHGADLQKTAIRLRPSPYIFLSEWYAETPLIHAYAYKVFLTQGLSAQYGLTVTDEELDAFIALLKQKNRP